MMGYDLIIPVYNEKNIVKLIEYIFKNSKKILNIYLCYDHEEDITLKLLKKSYYSKYQNIILLKNYSNGPCEAVKTGIKISNADAVIVYPADDFNNAPILDKMYELYEQGYDIVCPSRFIKGGIIKNCPYIKLIIVKLVSFLLFYFSKLEIYDPTNGFRLFSKELIKKNKIESKLGFAYSLELLIKAKKCDNMIIEIPSIWIERNDRKSSFKILQWSSDYLKWFFRAFY